MELSIDNVFDEKFINDNSYVDWAMELECHEALKFLRNVYRNWRGLVAPLDPRSLQGGLRAISYSCGIQWRVFSCHDVVSIAEKKEVLASSHNFFRQFVSQREDLRGICLMWWDDLGVFLSSSDEDAMSLDRKVLADSLLECLIQSVSQGGEREQLSAIHGLDCLDHPLTKTAVNVLLAERNELPPNVLRSIHVLLASR